MSRARVGKWPFNREMGRMIIAMRKKKKVTQSSLAVRVGLHRNTLHRYEVGDFDMPVQVLARIASALDSHLLALVPDARYTWEEPARRRPTKGEVLAELIEQRDPKKGAQFERDPRLTKSELRKLEA